MTALFSRIWTPRSDKCHRTPFRTGVDRALADAFPPMDDDALPDRIGAALVRLNRALHDIRPGSSGGGEPSAASSEAH